MSKTAVIFGGPSPEHDVSILTGLQTARELMRAGRGVTTLYWSKPGDWYVVPNGLEGADFVDGLPKDATAVELISGKGFVTPKKGLTGRSAEIDVDVAVNCCHGGPGEDGTLQGALELAGIRYTGPDVSGADLGMDKLAFSAVIAAAGLPALDRVAVTEDIATVDFAAPYIMKPRFGGSSIGIEIIDSIETAKALLRTSPHMNSGAVIEPYRPNSYDLNVAVRVFPRPETSAIEKPLRSTGASGKFLGYSDKYVGGEGMVSAPRELPADIPKEKTEAIREMTLQVANICRIRGVQRVDFLADGDELFVNEINTIPGSLAKHLWVEPVVPFLTLLDDMLREAVDRPSHHWTTAGADGSALRSAGSIAGKLS